MLIYHKIIDKLKKKSDICKVFHY